MKERFEGSAGRARLTAALQDQQLFKDGSSIIGEVAELVELIEVASREKIIVEDASDLDLYFILSGKFAIFVKGNQVATRNVGDSVGEMSAIEHSLPRAADVIAEETSVVARLSSENFHRVLDKCPILWKNLAKVLAKRLHQRNGALQKPNPKPHVFVISSVEALTVAQEIQSALNHGAVLQVWTDGVFFASNYALDSLEAAVDRSDFAIAVVQPDDVEVSRKAENKVARDNVIFELGLFMGRLGRKRTILFQPKGQELKLPSDLLGITTIGYEVGREEDLTSYIATACNDARKIIRELGVRKSRYGN